MSDVRVCFKHKMMDWGKGWNKTQGDFDDILFHLSGNKVISNCPECKTRTEELLNPPNNRPQRDW
jgi:hypothetical protein